MEERRGRNLGGPALEEMIRLEEVKKHYWLGKTMVEALGGVSLTIYSGDYASIMGPSGSGKSTLLHLIGALDRPTSGKVYIDGLDISSFNRKQLAYLRRKKIGFVFQQFNLLQRLTALENVEMPLWFSGASRARRVKRARELLGQVGLAERILHKPTELSGGEMQRVSIARALANNPDIILADEPTGNMDSVSGRGVMELLEQLNTRGKTLVVVTHDESFGKRAKRRIELRDGVVSGEN